MEEVKAWRVIDRPSRPNKPAASKDKLRFRLYFMMLVIDLLGMSTSFFLASELQLFHLGTGDAFTQLAMLAPLFVVVALLNRAYSPALVHDHWTSIGRAINALLLSSAAIVLIAFFLKTSGEWSRSTFAVGVGLSALSITLLRYIFVRNAPKLVGGEPYEVVVVCDGPMTSDMPVAGCTILVQSSDVFEPSQLSPATYDRFAEAIQHADRVIVHCPPERRQLWAMALKGANVQGEVIAPEVSTLNPIGIAHHGGKPTLIVSRGPLGLKDRMIKRAFDIAVAGTALFLLAPLLLIVALAVHLHDRGPVFFVQVRVGRSNRLFHILKFRSMYVAKLDSAGSRSASRDDDRITPIGRIIRATSVDEIPQLLNVLKGDMSIVGPRPHALGSTAEDLLFWHIDERYWHRHAIKPGLTGLAQVRGYRGATERKSDLINRLQSDLEYLDHWTVWRDILILIRTVGVVFHKNAY